MISTETVFIIGAGGSVPYGFPLGEKLVQNIIGDMNGSQTLFIQLNFSIEEIEKFSDRLRGSNLKSIDAFLEYQNDEIKNLGKVAIAKEIIKYTQYKYIDINDDWYKEVWNRMYSKPEILTQNKISFITFNYDLSLEHYLYNSMISSYDLPKDEIKDILSTFDIIHLHGQIGNPPWDGNYESDLDVLESSKGIKIISDEINDVKDFVKAHDIMEKAKRIYFMGFGYHALNIERLNFRNLENLQEIKGNSYGLTDLECAEIEKKFGMKIPAILEKVKGWKNKQFLRERVLLS